MENTEPKSVGRPVTKNNSDFGKLGLDTWEVTKLKDLLQVHDINLRRLLRKLVREWMKENTKR